MFLLGLLNCGRIQLVQFHRRNTWHEQCDQIGLFFEWIANLLSYGREHWSIGYGRRLIVWRPWVRIPAPYTGWTFFTLICCKIALMLVWKRLKINEKEAGDDPLKKLIMLQNYRKHYGNTGYILSQHLVTLSMIQFVIWQVLRQTTQSPILPIVSELYLVNIQISYAWN